MVLRKKLDKDWRRKVFSHEEKLKELENIVKAEFSSI
jgi:hypothetical protein